MISRTLAAAAVAALFAAAPASALTVIHDESVSGDLASTAPDKGGFTPIAAGSGVSEVRGGLLLVLTDEGVKDTRDLFGFSVAAPLVGITLIVPTYETVGSAFVRSVFLSLLPDSAFSRDALEQVIESDPVSGDAFTLKLTGPLAPGDYYVDVSFGATGVGAGEYAVMDYMLRFEAAAVPLPAAAPLLAGALGALAFARRRRG